MNCCDATGRCTNGHNCASRAAVPLRFAPGVIEHTQRHPFGTPQQRRELRRCIRYLGAAVVLCLAAIGAGLLGGFIWASVGLGV